MRSFCLCFPHEMAKNALALLHEVLAIRSFLLLLSFRAFTFFKLYKPDLIWDIIFEYFLLIIFSFSLSLPFFSFWFMLQASHIVFVLSLFDCCPVTLNTRTICQCFGVSTSICGIAWDPLGLKLASFVLCTCLSDFRTKALSI